VQQIAVAISARLRTADAAAIDDALLLEVEQALMKLSDAISDAYLTSNERSDFEWEALA
jgi:3-deoxy-D-arabino-heptulosonate 7-phosphate (DAHP) synthase class II